MSSHRVDTDSFERRIPIIVDTDIGGDIDDAWALAFLLQSPEFDIKLITTAVGDTYARAKIVAKILDAAGRSDIPIAIGLPEVDMPCYYGSWADDYDLSSYAGPVYDDSTKAIVDVISDSDQEVTVLALAPLTNLATALEFRPDITHKSKLVGMLGSVYLGYDAAPIPCAECNIVNNITAAKKVFSSAWDMLITPLDTCGLIKLKDEKYKKVARTDSTLVAALLGNYATWLARPGFAPNTLGKPADILTHSSTLFDTVAVYLAMSTDLLEIERLPIAITDDGYTVVGTHDDKLVNCATRWKDLFAFEDLLVERLSGSLNTVSSIPVKDFAVSK